MRFDADAVLSLPHVFFVLVYLSTENRSISSLFLFFAGINSITPTQSVTAK